MEAVNYITKRSILDVAAVLDPLLLWVSPAVLFCNHQKQPPEGALPKSCS